MATTTNPALNYVNYLPAAALPPATELGVGVKATVEAEATVKTNGVLTVETNGALTVGTELATEVAEKGTAALPLGVAVATTDVPGTNLKRTTSFCGSHSS